MKNVSSLVNEKPLHEAAVVYAVNGYKVFPLVANDKVPLPKSRGFKDATTDLTVNNGIWGRTPNLNIGLPTGQVTGVFVVDIDVKNGKDGEKALAELIAEYGDLPETLEQSTPSGGRHLFFKRPTDVRVATRQDHVVGIDIRGDGGYVVIAPSVIDGIKYEFTNPDVAVADAPEWLVTWINERKTAHTDLAGSDGLVREGGRNAFMFELSLGCNRDGMTIEEAREIVSAANREKCVPSLDSSEIESTLASAYRYEPNVEGFDEIIKLNRNHAVVMIGGKCRVLTEYDSPVDGNKDIEFSKPEDFKVFYCNRYVTVDGKKKQLGHYWLGHSQRRQYTNVGFYPKGAPADIYNLWSGFAVESKEGDCSLFLEHVRDNIANGNKDIYDYIIAWLADVVQNPDNLVGTALVLRGSMGVGKGVFANGFGSLFGKHYISLNQANQLVGRFNGHFKDKVILHADEAFWAGDKNAEGTLKSLITEPYITIEEKGLNAFSMKNHLHMIFSTNNSWAVPAGPKERRFFVMDVGEKRMQDSVYFGAINKQMNNGGREALLCYLRNYDLSGIDLRKFPQTEALWEQKLMSMTHVQKFWLDKLETGQLDGCLKSDASVFNYSDDWNEGKIECARLYKHYLEFVADLGVRHRMSSAELGVEMRKLLPGDRDYKGRPTVNGKREYVYRFPELDKCREFFCEAMNYQIEWPVVEEEEV
jgi:hypothetical protein